ncbi:hypothetical protein [Mycobacterium sp. AT1]|uniref:hypothetical protein n=1 Tax=Mycobacterium sp. AT1 TaxID=1961706 RepID=UPI001153372E|nr:hypothetical protein [Mycobacterium sp. AT1]
MSQSPEFIVALEHPRLSGARRPLRLTQSQHDYTDGTVLVEARDLLHAQVLRRRLLAANAAHEPLRVVVALTVHIAADAVTAFREVTTGNARLRDRLHYVGTARGLAGLVVDIGKAGVADGVCLRLAMDGSGNVLREIVTGVLPRLAAAGVAMDPAGPHAESPVAVRFSEHVAMVAKQSKYAFEIPI